MLDFAGEFFTEVSVLIQQGAYLLAAIAVLTVWWATRALVPVLVACVVAGIALFAVTPDGLSWLKDRIKDDTAELGVAPTGVGDDIRLDSGAVVALRVKAS